MDLRETRNLVKGQTEIDGYIPLGKRALIRGKITEPFVVGLGADTFLEMTKEEALQLLDSRLGSNVENINKDETADAGEEVESRPFEIIEEMKEEDLRLLEMKGKPRIAHKATAQTEKKTIVISPVTLAEELETLEMGPLRSRVIERTSDGRPIVDPGESVIGLQVKESLFKRRSAISPLIREGTTRFRAPEEKEQD